MRRRHAEVFPRHVTISPAREYLAGSADASRLDFEKRMWFVLRFSEQISEELENTKFFLHGENTSAYEFSYN